MAKSYDAFYVGGEWVRPSSAETIEVVNPATVAASLARDGVA